MLDTRVVNVTIVNMARALYKGDMDNALSLLKDFLATVNFDSTTRNIKDWKIDRTVQGARI